MPTELIVTPHCLGAWMTNCYIVASGDRCWLVDVGFDPATMLDDVADRGLTVEKIILTHAHVDHIAGLAEAVGRFPDAPILIHESEKDFPAEPQLNLSAFLADPVSAPNPTDTVSHNDTLFLEDLAFEIRHTPGHSPGGITLYQPDHGLALVGDTLFAGSIGRHDFPTSNYDHLERSIREQLYTLPDDTRVLPGHMDKTTVGHEKRTNPFVRSE